MRHGSAGLHHRAANLLRRSWSWTLLGLGAQLGLAAQLGGAALASAETDPGKSGGPSTELQASLSEQGPAGPWTLAVSNTGSTQMRLPSLQSIALEAQAPPKSPKSKPPKPVVCRLPKNGKESRPRGPEIEPGGTLAHAFDPRWYCFSPEGKTPLVPGARVRLLWGKKVSTNWLTLGPSYDLWRARPDGAPHPGVHVEIVGSDADDVRSATLTITVHNQTSEEAEVLMRHEALVVHIAGAERSVVCPAQWSLQESDGESGRWWESSANVERPRGTKLLPKKRKKATVRVFELCPRGTLASPGLYRVDIQLPVLSREQEEGGDGNGSHLVSSQRAGLVRIRNPLRLPLARRPESGAAPPSGPTAPTNEPFTPPPPAAPEPPPPTAIE